MDLATLGLALDSTPIEKGNASLDKLVATGAKAEQSAQRVGASYSKAARDIEAQVTKMLGEMQRMVAQQERTNDLLTQQQSAAAAAAKGLQTTQVAQAAVTKQATAMNQQLQQSQQQLKTTGATAQLSTQQMQGLAHSVRAFIDQVVAGGSPIKAAALETGKLVGTFGSFGNALEGIGAVVTPMRAALGLGAAAVAVLGLAYYQGSQEANQYAKAIVLSGNAAGTTVGQLQEMAKNVSAVVGTQGKAAEVLAMLAASGRVAADQLQSFAKMTVQLDQLGVEAKYTVADLAALGKDPVQASQKLNEALNYLTGSTYTQIKALQDLGQTEAAGELAQKAYAAAGQDRADRLNAQLGIVTRGWMSVKEAAAAAWSAMLNVGRPSSLEDQMATIQQQIDRARGSSPAPGLATPAMAAARAQLPDLLEQERRMQRILEITNGNAAAQGNVAKQSQATVEFDKLREQSLSRQEQLDKRIAEARNLGAQAGLTQAEIDKVIVGLSADMSKLGVEAQIERLQGLQQVMEVRTKSLLADLDAQRKMGAMNERAYMEQQAAIELADLDRKLASLQQQKELKKGERDSAKEVAAIAGQIAVVEAQRVARQQELNTGIKVYVASLEMARTLAKFEMQQEFDSAWAQEIVDYNKKVTQAQLDSKAWARSMTDANEELDFQAGLLGKTADEQAKLNEQHRIDLQLRDRKRQIDGLSLDATDKASLNAEAEETAAKAIAKIDTKLYVDKWNAANKEVGDSLYDALTGQGASARDRLKKMFADLVLRPILAPVSAGITNVLMGTGGQGGLLSGGSSGYSGGLLNNLGMIGAGYQALTGASVGASGASLTYANGIGALGGDSIGGLIAANGGWAGVGVGSAGAGYGVGAAGAGAAGALGGAGAATGADLAVAYGGAEAVGAGAAAAGGGAAAAATGVAAAIPVIGWVIAIAGILYSIFGNKGGGPKSEGYYNPYNSDQYYSSNHADVSAAARSGALGLQAQYDSVVSTYGGTGGIQFGMGFSTDPKGKAPSQAHIGAGLNGSTLFNLADTNIGRSEDDLKAAIAHLGSEAVLKGLQQSNIQGIIGDYLRALGDVTIKSSDEVMAAIARVEKAAQEKQALDENWFQITATEAEKIARTRERELAALDISNQAMAVRTYALQDEIAAQQKAQAVYADVVGEIDNMRKSIGTFLDRLGATSVGLASPAEQLAASKDQFGRQLDLARAGNRDAMQSITDYADQLLQAQIKYSASGPDTQATITQIKQVLGALPGQLNPEEYVGKAVMDGAFLLNATMEQLIARADANSAAQIAAITQKAADQNAAVAAQAAAQAQAAAAAVVAPYAKFPDRSQFYGDAIVQTGDGRYYDASSRYMRYLTPAEVAVWQADAAKDSPSSPQWGGPESGAAIGAVFSSNMIQRPTAFTAAATGSKPWVAGEAGTEAVMPLVNIGGSLGVRAIGGGSSPELVAEVRSLRTLVGQLLAVAAQAGRQTVNGLAEVAANTAPSKASALRGTEANV